MFSRIEWWLNRNTADRGRAEYSAFTPHDRVLGRTETQLAGVSRGLYAAACVVTELRS